MSKYNPSEYSKLRFKVMDIDILSYDPNKSFPEINDYPEFSDPIYLSQLGDKFKNVFAYIVLCYDFNSPHVKHNEILIKRKRDAATDAMFTKENSSKFDKFYEDIILCRNDVVNRMIIRFVRILRVSDWSTLVAYEEKLNQQLQKLLDNTGVLEPNDEKTIIASTKTLRQEIAELRSNILQGDTTESLKVSLYDTIETEELDLSPEDIARRHTLKENPKVFNPYKENKPIKEWIDQHYKNAR